MIFAYVVITGDDEYVAGLDRPTENVREASKEVKPVLLSAVR